VVKNIEAHPTEPKYRELSTASTTYTNKISSAKGGVRFLRALGFELKTLQGSSSAAGSAEAEDADVMVLSAPDAALLAEGKAALKVRLGSNVIAPSLAATPSSSSEGHHYQAVKHLGLCATAPEI